MDTNTILTSYFSIFAIYFIVSGGLTWLNIQRSKSSRGSAPSYFRDWITDDKFNRSIDYTLEKQYLGFTQSFISSCILIICILSGFFGYADNLVSSITSNKYIAGCIYIFALSFVSSILSLPFSYYSQFSIEERYGFNKMTPSLWITDLFKSTLLQLVIGLPILFGLFYLIDSLGEFWWLYAFLFISGIQLLLMFIYPVFIAPIFNKFSPLDEGDLKKDIFELADQSGFKTNGIFLMDGSKRSSHGNAYFTGFGGNKRIVLFDTLLETLENNEVLAVLAHEIGHEKKWHIKKSLVLSLFMLLLTFWLLSFLIDYKPLFLAFGFTNTSYHGALLLFGFLSEPIMYFISPLFSMLSRKFEFEADRFAVDLVKGAKSLQTALLRLSTENLSNLVPHPWYSFFHYSHPTLSERLEAMGSYAESKNLST